MTELNYAKRVEHYADLKRVMGAIYLFRQTQECHPFKASALSRYVSLPSNMIKLHLEFLEKAGALGANRTRRDVKTHYVKDQCKFNDMYELIFGEKLGENIKMDLLLGV